MFSILPLPKTRPGWVLAIFWISLAFGLYYSIGIDVLGQKYEKLYVSYDSKYQKP